MAKAIRRSENYDNDFSPSEARLREALAVVPPLAEEKAATVSSDAQSVALAEKAYRALHIGFVALPLIAGVDKFTNELASWGQYLAPSVPALFGVSPPAFMLGIGVFELLLGAGIALKPRLFADLLSAYLLVIIVNLLVSGTNLDVALFDFALAAGACGLARLSAARERGLFRSIPQKFETVPRIRGAA